VIADYEDVGSKRDQCFQPGVHFCQRERDCVRRQEQTLRIGELGTPPEFVLYHRAPQIDFAVDTASLVAELAQVLEVLRRVDSTSAVRVREFVSAMGGFGTSGDCSASSNPAARGKRLTRKPRLAVERLQPSGVPPPNAVPDYRRDVVGDVH
jgi:hypothetical protein